MPAKAKHPGLLIVLVGPSGVGKSTISRRLAGRMDLSYIVSATTRARRPGDENGKTYEYLTCDDFFRRLDADDFLEYAQVYGDYYGTPEHPALEDLAAGRNVLLEIDVQGALQVKYQYPDALLIFVLPPDEGTLLKRLQERKRDTAEQIGQRFRAARREIQMAKGSRAFDTMIVNDSLDRAVEEIVRLIHSHTAGGQKTHD